MLTPATTINWSTTPAFSYVSGQGTNSYHVQANSSSGTATITANITGACQSKSISKQVWIGAPYIDGTYNGGQLLGFVPFTPPPEDDGYFYYNPVCNGAYVDVALSPRGSSSSSSSGSFQKVSSNPSNISVSIDGTTAHFYFWAVNQTLQLKYTASNACGSVGNYYYFKSITCGGGEDPCSNQYSVSPNPSSATLSIIVPNVPPPCNMINSSGLAAKEGEHSENNLVIKSIRLYSADGLVKYSQKFSSVKNVSLDVTDLSKGIYILQISDGKYTELHKVYISD